MTREEALALPPESVVKWSDKKTGGQRYGRLVKVGYKNVQVEVGGGGYLPVKSLKLTLAEIRSYANTNKGTDNDE